ncbi:hypothetical protein RHGRI_004959 [Rhododendron griersonianum]|uniref:Uncharacterized protein n=1 Tax=Rhododendron griersonianum TaxID=479676 RepID=A0AAV6LAW3_9ERIC|nr:hypothetical protein RHGRI_004959 [Rhododendron griersonianum]
MAISIDRTKTDDNSHFITFMFESPPLLSLFHSAPRNGLWKRKADAALLHCTSWDDAAGSVFIFSSTSLEVLLLLGGVTAADAAQEIVDELDRSKELMRKQVEVKCNIEDNLKYRKTTDGIDELTHAIESLEEKMTKTVVVSTIEADLLKLSQERERLLSEVSMLLIIQKLDLKQCFAALVSVLCFIAVILVRMAKNYDPELKEDFVMGKQFAYADAWHFLKSLKE